MSNVAIIKKESLMWRIIIILVIVTVFMLSTLRYLKHQWIHKSALSERAKRWFKSLIYLTWGLMLVGLPSRVLGLNNSIMIVFFWVSYLAFGFYALAIFATIAVDIVSRLSRLRPKTHVNESRRNFLSQGAAIPAASLAGVGSAYGVSQTRQPQLIEVDIPLKNLPEAFEGYRIVQISDLHVGLTIREPFVRAVAELCMAQRPDAIALTGDLLDGEVDELSQDMSPMSILQAPDGVYYCTGNHEYYSGAIPWLTYFRNLGWRCLMNEHHLIERDGAQLAMCGVTDLSAHQMIPEHRSDPAKALLGLSPTLCKIMLAHQPKSIYSVPKGQIDLMLSGHTHGGQFFPWSLLVKLAQPYLKGLYRHDKRASVYVNQGTGYWGPPLRIKTVCEVTLITLRRAQSHT
jgi:hypothetical protein